MTREEAIARIMEAMPTLWKGTRDAIQTLIPELAESDDERVRKELVAVFEDLILPDDQRRRFLAYLEKQKEQKPAIKLVFPRFRVGDIIRNVHDEWDKTTKRISYVGEHGYNFDYRHLGDKAGGGSFGFCYEDYYELVKQKPAEWSEEDDAFRDLLICILKNEHPNGIFSMSAKHISALKCDVMPVDRIIAWLKSLHPQPKAELTLLDENIIKAAVAFVEQNDHFNCWGGIDKHTVIKALRSLKPHWKPNEEQMRFLLAVINEPNNAGSESCHLVLKELYEQLKTL